MQQEEYGLYIVISQTGTALSRMLKVITGAPYNHVSVSLCRDLRRMYSFGRRHPYNPVWGGFVLESPHHGTFKRFPKTDCVVLYKSLNKEQYIRIEQYLHAMYRDKYRYGYNTWGLMLAALGIDHKSRHERYYCSEFARDLLVRFNVEQAVQFPAIVKPMDLLNVRNSHVIYRGKLKDYVRA